MEVTCAYKNPQFGFSVDLYLIWLRMLKEMFSEEPLREVNE